MRYRCIVPHCARDSIAPPTLRALRESSRLPTAECGTTFWHRLATTCSFPQMKRTLALVITLGTAACSSCSNGDNNSNDGGGGGGSCKNIVICTTIPLAQV